MSNLAEQLLQSASAVAALGRESADIRALDDASVTAGLGIVRDHRRNLQAYELLLAAEISRRSSHEFGNGGLARSNGAATPAILIQSITGSSLDEATKLALLGAMVVSSEIEAASAPHLDGRPDASQDASPGADSGADSGDPDAPDPSGHRGGIGTGPQTGLASAALSGELSVAAADAIRKGLGRPDNAITFEQLRAAERELLADAGKVSPEALLKMARIARNNLDLEAIARGQKKRQDLRYARIWQRDGMTGGSFCLPDEDGGREIYTALKLAGASRTGGPRFPETDADGNPKDKSAAETVLEDPRSLDQVTADTFAQIVLNGLHIDPTVVPGASRAAVRVMVPEQVLVEQRGSALLEDSLSAVTFSKLEEYLCEGGTVGILFDSDGDIVNVGREQRLFTKRQRTALGVRDGGCRFPLCDKPPSWTEAHHIHPWARDKGRTDLAEGILLCRYHHMFIHDSGAEIIRQDEVGKPSTYWLKPSKLVDPTQTLIEMPSKNPLISAMRALAVS